MISRGAEPESVRWVVGRSPGGVVPNARDTMTVITGSPNKIPLAFFDPAGAGVRV